MSFASRGLAPREGLECLVDEDGSYKPAAQPRRGPQAGKSGDPRSENADTRIYTTYASVSMKWVVSVDWTAECQKRRGKPSLSKTSIFKHLAAFTRVQINIM